MLRSAVLCLLVLVAGCRVHHEAPLFEKLAPDATGVLFANMLSEGPDFSIFTYPYYYNGGGVAVGDVNGDGRVDLFFTSNEAPNVLYLNRSNLSDGGEQGLRFEDVTEIAGVGGLGNWTTGAVMADVNADGRLDLYVMNVGGYRDRSGRNELFINEGPGPDGVPRFSEQGAAYGLDFEGYSTHAAFFDYDRDGDLDVYLLNHSTHTERTYRPAEQVRVPHERAGDRLLRNDPAPDAAQGSRFVDVTEEAGIYSGAAGYGLSVAVADFDDDGWPDLYVGNDFHENDFLYRNNRDGSFAEIGTRAMGHTSTFSMGSDAADIDGDGRLDLVVLDMLPAREEILKTSAGADTYALSTLKRTLGYGPQLPRNTLQLNRGATDSLVYFSDVAYLTGIAATDWSWSALLADYDNDGHRDLYVTNGIFRRPNDLDYVSYISGDVVQQALRQGDPDQEAALLHEMPQVPIANYAFRGRGGLAFDTVAEAWGLADAGFSSGAAYADLDNDGDLDLVVNNTNAVAAIYQNHADRLADRHFLTLVLDGEGGNRQGLGTRVTAYAGGRRIVAEQSTSRGFLSSVDPRLHLGLGAAAQVDSLVVRWPDGRVQRLASVAVDQRITLHQANATERFVPPRATPALFRDVTAEMRLPYTHRENEFVDFNRERLMPHRRSMEGPAVAVGDVDGDGRDDVFLGGAKYQPGTLLIQQPSGRFAAADVPDFRADSLAEDVDATLFDADADGDLDLYVVSGGNEFWGEAEPLRDRFYRNDGGTLRRDPAALPRFFASGNTVAAGDVDGDGDLDLFVGSLTVPRAYGETPTSYLLENDGRGSFTDATADRAPALAQAGMIADAAWGDLDGDGDLDLAVVGEWMAPTVFENRDGYLAPMPATGLEASTGWWNRLSLTDLDGDGDLDLAAGNLGLNSRIQARPGEPARLYLNDYDANGQVEGILATYRDGTEYPEATLDLLRAQFPFVRRAYPTYGAYGARRVDEVLPRATRHGERVREATTFASAWMRNDGTGSFTLEAFPAVAQVAPIYALAPGDFDGDGHTDLLVAGNFSGVPPDRGQEDASFGLLLKGTGDGFLPVELPASGLVLTGDVRAVVPVRVGTETRLLVVRNDAAPLVLALPATGRPGALATKQYIPGID